MGNVHSTKSRPGQRVNSNLQLRAGRGLRMSLGVVAEPQPALLLGCSPQRPSSVQAHRPAGCPCTHLDPQIHCGGWSGPPTAAAASERNAFLPSPLPMAATWSLRTEGQPKVQAGPLPRPCLLLSWCSCLLRPFPGYGGSVASSSKPP